MNRYYYYQSERGCLKHPDSLDELGVGIKDGQDSCGFIISLLCQGNGGFDNTQHFSMQLAMHNDEWAALMKCRDVLDLLSERLIPSGQMDSQAPFYALRADLEELGYKNLGLLHE